MKKKLLALLLALTMVVTYMPTTLFATNTDSQSVKIVKLKAESVSENQVRLKWKRVKKATRYKVFVASKDEVTQQLVKEGSADALETQNFDGLDKNYFHKVKTLKASKNPKFVVKKLAGKKLQADVSYLYRVVAYNKNKKIAQTKTIEFITGQKPVIDSEEFNDTRTTIDGSPVPSKEESKNDSLKTSLTSPKLGAGLEEQEVVSYTVNFYVEDPLLGGRYGVRSSQIRYGIKGTTVTVNPDEMVLEGYEYDSSNNDNYLSGVNAGKLVLKLYYKAKEYTVTYSANMDRVPNGADVEVTKTVKYGNILTIAGLNTAGFENFAKPEGLVFAGWSTDPNGGLKTYQPKDLIAAYDKGNITLYAQYTGVNYKVRFNKNDGSASTSTQDMVYGESQTLKPYADMFNSGRTGYSFLGWATTAGATGATYFDAQEVSNLASQENAIVDLYAVWSNEEVTYTVEYYKNEYDSSKSKWVYPTNPSSKQIFAAETGTTVTAQQIQYDRYQYDEGYASEVTSGTVKADGSLTLKLYYKCVNVDYYVYYYQQDKEGKYSASESNPTYKDKFTADLGESKTAEIKTYTVFTYDETKTLGVNSLTATIQKPDQIIKVYYTRNKHKVTYKFDGDAPTTAPAEKQVYYNVKIPAVEVEPIMSGYQFTGWNVSGKVKKVNGSDYMQDEDVVYTGKWELLEFNITFDGNGNKGGSMSNQKVKYGSETPLNENQFTPNTHYSFDGWNTKADGSGIKISNMTIVNDTLSERLYNINHSTDITLYAQWKEDTESIVVEYESKTQEQLDKYGYNGQILCDGNESINEIRCWNLTVGVTTGTITKTTCTKLDGREVPYESKGYGLNGKKIQDLKFTAVDSRGNKGNFAMWKRNPGNGWQEYQVLNNILYVKKNASTGLFDGASYKAFDENQITLNITFEKNNTSATGSMAVLQVMRDDAWDRYDTDNPLKLYKNKYKLTNYTFTGWNTSPDGTGLDSAVISDENDLWGMIPYKNQLVRLWSLLWETYLTENITLYAQWDENQASIKIVTEDGTSKQGTISIDGGQKFAEYSDTVGVVTGLSSTKDFNTLQITANPEANYHFDRWYRYVNSEGKSTIIEEPTIKVSRNADGVFEDSKYTAIFRENQYDLVYHVTTEEYGELTYSDRFLYATKDYEIPSLWNLGKPNEQGVIDNIFQHLWYKLSLIEWNTKPDGTGTSYKAGDIVKFTGRNHNEKIDLYAQFETGTISYMYGTDLEVGRSTLGLKVAPIYEVKKTYILGDTIEVSDGSGTNITVSSIGASGSTTTLKANEFKSDYDTYGGMKFMGWVLADGKSYDLSDSFYKPGAELDTDSTRIREKHYDFGANNVIYGFGKNHIYLYACYAWDIEYGLADSSHHAKLCWAWGEDQVEKANDNGNLPQDSSRQWPSYYMFYDENGNYIDPTKGMSDGESLATGNFYEGAYVDTDVMKNTRYIGAVILEDAAHPGGKRNPNRKLDYQNFYAIETANQDEGLADWYGVYLERYDDDINGPVPMFNNNDGLGNTFKFHGGTSLQDIWKEYGSKYYTKPDDYPEMKNSGWWMDYDLVSFDEKDNMRNGMGKYNTWKCTQPGSGRLLGWYAYTSGLSGASGNRYCAFTVPSSWDRWIAPGEKYFDTLQHYYRYDFNRSNMKFNDMGGWFIPSIYEIERIMDTNAGKLTAANPIFNNIPGVMQGVYTGDVIRSISPKDSDDAVTYTWAGGSREGRYVDTLYVTRTVRGTGHKTPINTVFVKSF